MSNADSNRECHVWRCVTPQKTRQSSTRPRHLEGKLAMQTKKRFFFFLLFPSTYPACDPSAQRSQRRSCAPAPRASCPSCLQMSGEACAAAQKAGSDADADAVAMRKGEGDAGSSAAMLRRAIGGGAAAVAGGFCRNFYKSDSSLQRARAVARFWPPHSSWCTVTAAWPATTSAASNSQQTKLHHLVSCNPQLNSTQFPVRQGGW